MPARKVSSISGSRGRNSSGYLFCSITHSNTATNSSHSRTNCQRRPGRPKARDFSPIRASARLPASIMPSRWAPNQLSHSVSALLLSTPASSRIDKVREAETAVAASVAAPATRAACRRWLGSNSSPPKRRVSQAMLKVSSRFTSDSATPCIPSSTNRGNSRPARIASSSPRHSPAGRDSSTAVASPFASHTAATPDSIRVSHSDSADSPATARASSSACRNPAALA